MKLFFLIAVLLITSVLEQPAQAVNAVKAPLVATNSKKEPVANFIQPSFFKTSISNQATWFQKLKWRAAQHLLYMRGKYVKEPLTERQAKQAKWALILGLGGLVLLLLSSAAGFFALLALPTAIVGLILGLKSTKGNSNTKGIVGIVASSLTLFLLLIAVIFALTFLSALNGG